MDRLFYTVCEEKRKENVYAPKEIERNLET